VHTQAYEGGNIGVPLKGNDIRKPSKMKGEGLAERKKKFI